MNTAFEVLAKLSLDTKPFMDSLKDAKEESQDEKGWFAGIEKGAMVASAAATAILTGAGGIALTEEGAFAKVRTIMDENVVSFEDMSNAIRGLSNETGASIKDLGNSVYNAISATGDTAGAIDLVRTATQLATAGFTDSESALGVLTTAMNSYGYSAADAERLADSLIKTQNLGVTTVADLSSNMGRAISTASAFNVDLGNLEASYIALTKQGINTAEATTYMTGMFNELGDSGSKVGQIIQEKTGKTFGQLMTDGASLADVLDILSESVNGDSEAMMNLWGNTRAGKAANAIMTYSVSEFNKALVEVGDSAGTTATAYEMMQTNGFKLKRMGTQLKNTLGDLGGTLLETLGPSIEKVVGWVKKFADWFAGLDDNTKKVIITVVGLVAALGPMIKIVKNAGTAIKGLGKVFDLIAAHPIIAAIAGITAAVIYLWNNCEWFRDAVKKIWEAITGFFTKAWEVIKGVWEGVVDFFKGIWEGIKKVFSVVKDVLVGFFSAAWKGIKIVWDGVVSFFSTIWDGIKKVFSGVVDFFKGIFEDAVSAIKAVWDGITGFFGTVWDGIKGAFSSVGDFFASVFGDAEGEIETAFDDATGYAAEAMEEMRKIAEGKTDDIATEFDDVSGYVQKAMEKMGLKNKEVGDALPEPWRRGRVRIVGEMDKVKEYFNNLSSRFKKWLGIEDSETWGRDLVKNFARGIDGELPTVINSTAQMANQVKKRLAFSEPEEGPLSNFHTYAPDMMQLFADGVKENTRVVTDQIEKSFNFDKLMSGTGFYTGGSAMPATNYGVGGGYTQNVYITSPEALDPSEVARQTRNATRNMVLALRGV